MLGAEDDCSPPAPGPLEDYVTRFDDPFSDLAQRRGFHEYLTGLRAPRERNKTLTGLARADPANGAGAPGAPCVLESCSL